MAWLGTWQNRRKVTIDNTNIDSDLTHFPVAIVLGTSVGQSSQDVSDIFDEVGANSLKIAITKTDGTTQIYGDIETWDDTAEKAVIHCAKSDLDITAAAVTELYIYFDSAQSDNTTYISLSGGTAAQSVWDSNFIFVCHKNQIPAGADSLRDSTANNTDADTVNMDIINVDSDGFYITNGIDENINFGQLATQAIFTIEAQVKRTNAATENYINTYKNGSVDNSNWIFGTDSTGELFFVDFDGGVTYRITLGTTVFSPGVIINGTATFAADNIVRLYADGVLENSSLAATSDVWYNVDYFEIGMYNYAVTPTYTASKIGEVRLSNLARSSAWIKATNYALTDDLVTFAAAEEMPTWLDSDLPTLSIEAHSGASADATLPTLSLITPEYVIVYLFQKLPQLKIEAFSGQTRLTGDMTLPTLSLEAEFGQRGSLDEILPTLSCEARAGAVLDSNLPEIAIEATCLVGVNGSLDSALPILQVESRGGSRADLLKFSTLQIEAEASSPVLCKLDKVLPGLQIEATSTGASGTLAKILPFPKLTAAGSRTGNGTLDKTLPGLKITATGLAGAIGTLDKTLPELRIESQSNSVIISLDAYLPQITTSVATGGETGNVDNVMTETGRFSGTLLKYSRWA